MEFPVSHTVLPEEKRWEQFEARWLAIGARGGRATSDHHADAALVARPVRRGLGRSSLHFRAEILLRGQWR
jgi:hypothetical protein